MKKEEVSVKSNNKKIAKNTLMLYFRHILIMLVTLYTVRIVLNALGVEDYGIYNVVGGVVAMFSFFSSTMASASQRFFSYALGLQDTTKLSKTFSTNWIIYGLIAILVLFLLETVGLWFIKHQLSVPPDRLDAALWVYHFSALSFLCSIMMTPFMAMIIAHEDMNIYAYIAILEATLKLLIVFLLTSISCDKLQLYGILNFLSTLLVSFLYLIICRNKYKECRFRLLWDKAIFKEVFSYTGWSIFGSISVVIRNQAVTILLNQMFNPIVVAARVISTQVSNNVNVFSNNFNTGLYPPIIKSYAANEREQMLRLIFNGSKITYFLMYLFTLPLFLEMPFLLHFWLKEPPDGTVIFTRLALIDSLITSISLPLMTAVRATGKIKIYELSLGSILIGSFFISWFVIYLGAQAYNVMIVTIVTTAIMFIFRLLLLKRILNFPIVSYLRKVVFPVLIMSIVSFILSFIVSRLIPDKFIYICIAIFISLIITCVSMYFIGLRKHERAKILEIIISKIKVKIQ